MVSIGSIVIRVDGEPAAVAKRLTFDGATYLSSIGSRPAAPGPDPILSFSSPRAHVPISSESAPTPPFQPMPAGAIT